jgi:hypothetical protein
LASSLTDNNDVLSNEQRACSIARCHEVVCFLQALGAVYGITSVGGGHILSKMNSDVKALHVGANTQQTKSRRYQ